MTQQHMEREMIRLENAASKAAFTARRISNIVGTDAARANLYEAARLLDEQADRIRETLNPKVEDLS